MVSLGRNLAWSSVAVILVLVGAVFLAARWDAGPVASGQRAADLPTRADAEALLARAHGLAQAPERTGLCQAVAQNPEACRKILQWADEAHARPSTEAPSVDGVSTVPHAGNTQGAIVLRIRGSLANGSPYTGEFSAVRTESGEIRSQNAVYWYSSLAWPSS